MFTLCQQSDIKTSLAHFKQPEVLSDNYITINSMELKQVLEDDGMTYIGLSHGNPYKPENRGFQKHIMMFDTGFKVDDNNMITLLVTNSYNGKTSLQFNLGVFRFVCANGLVVGNSLFKERILHKGDSYNKLSAILTKIKDVMPILQDNAQRMIQTTVNPIAAEAYTKEVLEYAYNDQLQRYDIVDFSIHEAIHSRHSADNDTNVYTMFNRVQENVCKYGVRLAAKPDTMESNKSNLSYRKMRPIKNIDRYKDVNQFMWDKALEYSA